MKRLKQLEDEKGKLKPVADLSLDKGMLQDVIRVDQGCGPSPATSTCGPLRRALRRGNQREKPYCLIEQCS
jgi:hypothetical protein